MRELRMSRPVFYKLCARLRERGLLVDTLHVSVEEQLTMFLKIVGQCHTHSSVAIAMWRSGWTVSTYSNTVLCAIVKLAHELIYVRSISTHPKITERPNKFYPYFEGCIGALDGTHIKTCVPAKSVDRFRGCKSYPTQNVLAVVDFDLHFTYVLAGWEGSAHDSLVLQDALSCPNGLKIPEGKFYLADAGYATRPGILPPYREVCYHLKEFHGAQDPKCPKELFNHRHSQLRTTVERAFGALKNCFKILSNKPFVPLKSQAKVVIACCALHNWILDDGPDEFIYDEPTWYNHLPRSKNRVSDRQADVREWAVKRDSIAQQMWNDRFNNDVTIDN
ncbi:protein ALP1-like [Miscanthus floridulus]|uniref:protein ALP1-like n=1 Tax=Miscanthus floridulus TaxID=154761 RepID=UPI003458DCAA